MKSFSFNGLKESTNKEQILAKVRNAILEKNENHFSNINLQNDTWQPFAEDDGPEFTFINRFKENGGIFIYFESKAHFIDCLKQFIVENGWAPLWSLSPKIKEVLAESEIELSEDYREPRKKLVSLIDCECLIAQTGSVVLSDAIVTSRAAYTLPDTLLIYAKPSQILPKMKDAFQFMKEKYPQQLPSQMTIVSGPSCSTAIDNTLVVGAHGVKQLALFLVEE